MYRTWASIDTQVGISSSGDRLDHRGHPIKSQGETRLELSTMHPHLHADRALRPTKVCTQRPSLVCMCGHMLACRNSSSLRPPPPHGATAHGAGRLRARREESSKHDSTRRGQRSGETHAAGRLSCVQRAVWSTRRAAPWAMPCATDETDRARATQCSPRRLTRLSAYLTLPD